MPLRHLSAAQRAEASRIMDAHTRPEALTRLLKRVPDVYSNEIKMRFLRAIAVALATREPAPNPIHDAKAIVAIDAVDTAHAVSTTALRLLVASLTFLAARPDATEQLMQQIERIVSTVPFTPDTEQRAFRRMLIEHIRKAVELNTLLPLVAAIRKMRGLRAPPAADSALPPGDALQALRAAVDQLIASVSPNAQGAPLAIRQHRHVALLRVVRAAERLLAANTPRKILPATQQEGRRGVRHVAGVRQARGEPRVAGRRLQHARRLPGHVPRVAAARL